MSFGKTGLIENQMFIFVTIRFLDKKYSLAEGMNNNTWPTPCSVSKT